MDDLKIVYKSGRPEITKYYDLFLTTGWNTKYKLSSAEIEKAIKKSWYIISVYIEERLIGFGRILSDGSMHALIIDVIVHPDFQNRGIGRNIMEILIEQCEKHRIRDVQLFCAKGKTGFYKRLGFVERPPDAPGMELK